MLEFRTGLRRFVHWSEQAAAAAGLSPAVHQLLLAVRGSSTPGGPTIGELADSLVVKHHTAVEAVDRAQRAGLVVREGDAQDLRVVRVRLTEAGHARLNDLTAQHLDELARLAPSFAGLWANLDSAGHTGHTGYTGHAEDAEDARAAD